MSNNFISVTSIEQASPEAKGFVSNNVITPAMAEAHINNHYEFCLRVISDPEKDFTCLTAQEASRIMSHPTPTSSNNSYSYSNCYGLKLMPLYLVYSPEVTASNFEEEAIERAKKTLQWRKSHWYQSCLL